MHYIPRNLSVCPHLVRHCVRIFDALLRNNLYQFFTRCRSKFFYSLKISDAFCKSSFFLSYTELLCDGDQLQQLLMHCFGVHVPSVLPLCSKRKKCACSVYKPSVQEVRSAVKMFCSSRGWSHADTDSIMRCCMANHFLISCK